MHTGPWAALWPVIGVTGAIIFCGRFYLQWIASEIKKRSVVPIGFWYMSSVGSLMLLPYAVFFKQSPIGALSHSFNLVVYARNLIHIWREQDKLNKRRSLITHAAVALVVITAIVLAAHTWMNEFQAAQAAPADDLQRTWFWLGAGVLGQGLFGCRFLLQWMATEARRKSVVPLAFWYISLAAAALLVASFLKRPEPEWVFVCQVAAPIPVYLRNLWLIHRHKQPAADTE